MCVRKVQADVQSDKVCVFEHKEEVIVVSGPTLSFNIYMVHDI